MRLLKIFEHISIDGVIEARGPGQPGDFPYGDWSEPYRTPAGREALLKKYGERFDLLLGRTTYDQWSGFWPQAPSSPFADRLNAATKYVATHRPESLAWGPYQAVGPDLVADVRRLKASEGPDVCVSGSSTLTSVLIEHGLADEIVLMVNPLVLGTGKRFFAEGTPARSFELADSQTTATGIVVNTYKNPGPLKSAPPEH